MGQVHGRRRHRRGGHTVDDATGENTITYSVGWDLSTSGSISSYSGTHTKTGWVGSTTAELGLDIADMDGNGKPDLVISWVDAPSGDDTALRERSSLAEGFCMEVALLAREEAHQAGLEGVALGALVRHAQRRRAGPYGALQQEADEGVRARWRSAARAAP